MDEEREQYLVDMEYLENQLWASLEKFLAEGGDMKEVAMALKQESSLYYSQRWTPADMVANLMSELSGLGEISNLARRFREDEEAKDYPLPSLLAEYAPASLD